MKFKGTIETWEGDRKFSAVWDDNTNKIIVKERVEYNKYIKECIRRYEQDGEGINLFFIKDGETTEHEICEECFNYIMNVNVTKRTCPDCGYWFEDCGDDIEIKNKGK